MTTATADSATMAQRIFTSTIGLKVVMAVTGALGVGFVLGHMIGNLQVLLPAGPDGLYPINKYAHMLQSLGGLLWAARLGLIAILILHVWAAISLKKRNVAARPVGYDQQADLKASKPSKLMTLSGMTILAFLLYHLAHFTFGLTGAEYNQYTPAINGIVYHDVQAMVIGGFQQPLVAGLYIIANILLGLHLHHAATSMFQTLGLRRGGYRAIVDKVGPALAVVVIAGNVTMPLAVLLGIIK